MVELLITIAIVGILATLASGAYQDYRERVRVAQAVTDIAGIGALIARFDLDNRRHPDSLGDVGAGSMRDPWGNAYQYVNHDDNANRGQWRKDKNIVPINTDFDLFSMGKDGNSQPPLTPKASRDDIVRANDGRFVGLAADYDP